MLNSVSFNSVVSMDGWTVEFTAPLSVEMRRLRDEATGEMWSECFVSGFESVSKIIAEKESDLVDVYIPEFLTGTLAYPPDEQSDDDYAAFFDYLSASVGRIFYSLPANMTVKEVIGGQVIEVELNESGASSQSPQGTPG